MNLLAAYQKEGASRRDRVVVVVNRQPITIGDILDEKRKKQRRRLNRIRQPCRIIKPCYVWVFDNGPIFPFGGTWLYVRTSRKDYWIGRSNHAPGIVDEIMAAFPCGHDDLDEWKRAFMDQFPRPSDKRKANGLALAWCVVSSAGRLEHVVATKAGATRLVAHHIP